MRAVDAASDALYRAGTAEETEPKQRRADAVGLLAERALAVAFGRAERKGAAADGQSTNHPPDQGTGEGTADATAERTNYATAERTTDAEGDPTSYLDRSTLAWIHAALGEEPSTGGGSPEPYRVPPAPLGTPVQQQAHARRGLPPHRSGRMARPPHATADRQPSPAIRWARTPRRQIRLQEELNRPPRTTARPPRRRATPSHPSAASRRVAPEPKPGHSMSPGAEPVLSPPCRSIPARDATPPASRSPSSPRDWQLEGRNSHGQRTLRWSLREVPSRHVMPREGNICSLEGNH